MGEEKSIRSLLPPEKHFRWRAGEISRLEAFCDVVFGFAITLLVVSLEVPHSFAELKIALRGFLPFAICFAQFILIWLTHYRFSRRFGLEDSYTVFLNMVLLFLVLFYVYPLKFLFTLLIGQVFGWEQLGALSNADAALLMKIYGIGFAGVFALFTLMHHHAVALAEKLELNAIELYQTRLSMQENFALMLFGLVSFALAFKSAPMAGWVYMLIGVYFWIRGSLAGKRKKKLLSPPPVVEPETEPETPAET
jgi:uncharacterized membrane protein